MELHLDYKLLQRLSVVLSHGCYTVPI